MSLPRQPSAAVNASEVAWFNGIAHDELTAILHTCCDTASWVAAVLDGRPYNTRDELIARADHAARELNRQDVDHALAAHPRIGDRSEGSDRGSAWSRNEQSGVARDRDTLSDLSAANEAYERRFNRVFLICASGLSSAQILTALQERLANDEETERGVVADELRKIAVLRLEKVLEA